MNLIKLSIDRPIAVIAAVLMVILFGIVALQNIPIQLAPDVDRPVISVRTDWPGAAPAEVEREILNRQEEQMAGISGLQSMTGEARNGSARLTLEFSVDSDIDKSLLLVSNRLDRVTGYPADVIQPTLDTAGSEDNPIAWFSVGLAPGNERDIHEYGDFVRDIIKDRIERVPGISAVNVFGASERQIHVIVEPELMAGYLLTVTDVVNALQAANISVSAGDVDEGKRRYVVRAVGELSDLDAVRDVALRGGRASDGGRVRLGDIAAVEYGYTTPGARIRQRGEQALAVNATRETGANVISTMRGLRKAVDELQRTVMPSSGLTLVQNYDETIYINSAIDLVKQNIYLGGALAIAILLLFLRSWRPTVIVGVAIPVAVIGSFVAMASLGRSINVISLAGLAFAVGMVVDAAIVVMENIYRHREAGHSARDAAYHGTSRVWGAVLVSALTTVMVFIPILVMKLEVGQLFRDIAVAISVSVLLSLIVAATVIPAMSQWLLRTSTSDGRIKRLSIPGVDHFARGFVATITGYVRLVARSNVLSFVVAFVITALAAFATVQYLPKLEYLPEGNRNLVFGIIIPPPGYNLNTVTGIAEDIEAATRSNWASEPGETTPIDQPPKIDRFFFVATPGRTFVVATSAEPQRVSELLPALQGPVFREPGTFGFMSQPSIFGRGIGGGRKIEFDISGPNLDTLVQVAGQAFGIMSAEMSRGDGYQHRPIPGLELGSPEVRLQPDRMRLADNGLTTRDLALAVDTFNDGVITTEVADGGKTLDIVLRGPENFIDATQDIGNLPVVTADGQIVPTAALSKLVMTAGPVSIRHRERFRTITLEVRVAPGVPLQSALDTLETKVIQPMEAAGLPPGVRFGVSGTASKLAETWEAMKWQLGLALVIVFLVMAVLFESFIYPLIILLSVPVAAAGGVGGLTLLNAQPGIFQPLDMLTLLGFVILIGIVVNNAILLVHQALIHIREDQLEPVEAIINATRNRIRPIFMSTLTSVFGMLPLVLIPGAGSELYRGLGSVVVGGLALSAILTLLIVPPMMKIVMVPLEKRRLLNNDRMGIAPDPHSNYSG